MIGIVFSLYGHIQRVYNVLSDVHNLIEKRVQYAC